MAPETENSFDFGLVKVSNPSEESDDYTRFGKLTLEGIQFKGKAGADLIPPMKFEYELEDPLRGIGYVYKQSGEGLVTREYVLSQTNSELSEGDIIKIISSDRTCYAVVYEITGGTHKIRILGKLKPYDNQNVSWSTTKNPPYNKDNYDIWGFYKSDYVQLEKSDLSRIVTEVSSKNIDAWSLRRVSTQTGAEIRIEYQSDNYTNAVAYKGSLFINNLSIDESTTNYIVADFLSQSNLENYNVKPGDLVTIIGSLRYLGLGTINATCFSDGYGLAEFYKWDLINQVAIVREITSNQIKFESSGIYNQLQRIYGQLYVDCNGYTLIGQQTSVVYNFTTPGVFIGGTAIFDKPLSYFGGGIRVSKLDLKNESTGRSTLYEYSNGVTSYEPFGIDGTPLSTLDFVTSLQKKNQKNAIRAHKSAYYKNFSGLVATSRELPAPGVIYGVVRVKEEADGLLIQNYYQYDFNVFDTKTVTVDTLYTNSTSSTSTYDNITFKKIRRKDVLYNDFSARVGQLKGKSLFTIDGIKLNETTNHFLFDSVSGASPIEAINDYKLKLSADFNSQGVIAEVTMDGRFAKNEDGDFELLGIVSRRHQLPVIQTGQTTMDYKSGITTTTQNLAFDFYSGQVTKTLTKDGYGNTYVSESKPAYRVYPTLGLSAQGGYNMLTQEASSYTYKIDPNNNNAKIGLVSGGIQTWSGEIDMLEHAELRAPLKTHNC